MRDAEASRAGVDAAPDERRCPGIARSL